jgi:hypothetical protein
MIDNASRLLCWPCIQLALAFNPSPVILLRRSINGIHGLWPPVIHFQLPIHAYNESPCNLVRMISAGVDDIQERWLRICRMSTYSTPCSTFINEDCRPRISCSHIKDPSLTTLSFRHDLQWGVSGLQWSMSSRQWTRLPKASPRVRHSRTTRAGSSDGPIPRTNYPRSVELPRATCNWLRWK